MSLRLPWDSLLLIILDTSGLDGKNWLVKASHSDFLSDGAVESKRLDRRHTYQFLMGLKPKFEALQTHILNTSHLPP